MKELTNEEILAIEGGFVKLLQLIAAASTILANSKEIECFIDGFNEA